MLVDRSVRIRSWAISRVCPMHSSLIVVARMDAAPAPTLAAS
jgi:hypothetical protein